MSTNSSEDQKTSQETVEEFQKRMMKERPAQAVGVKYTLDGEVIAMSDDTEITLPVPEIKEMPKDFRLHHASAMNTIAHFISRIKAEAPKRQLPALRSELVDFGVPKQTIAELGRMGLVQERLIATLDTNQNNKPVGSRAIVYFTTLGKAYFKACARAVEARNAVKAVPSDAQERREPDPVPSAATVGDGSNERSDGVSSDNGPITT